MGGNNWNFSRIYSVVLLGYVCAKQEFIPIIMNGKVTRQYMVNFRGLGMVVDQSGDWKVRRIG